MAQIVINEVSDNYTYNIGRNSFATVALPITAMWGPAFMNWSGEESDDSETQKPKKLDGSEEPNADTLDEMLENIEWKHFPATQEGLESFVSTYRGPASNYKRTKDFSYQMAMTLLTAGYDVLVCRLCPGTYAQGSIAPSTGGSKDANLLLQAKYPGTFGNNLKVVLNKVTRGGKTYWNLVTYVVDVSGIQTAVENISFVFDVENSTDTLLHVDEVESNFLTIISHSGFNDDMDNWFDYVSLHNEPSDWGTIPNTKYYAKNGENTYKLLDSGGGKFIADKYYERVETTSLSMMLGSTDAEKGKDTLSIPEDKTATIVAKAYAYQRYTSSIETEGGIAFGAGYASSDYCTALNSALESMNDIEKESVACREWQFTAAYIVYQLLKDKLNYNPQRIISPGWDDQDFSFLEQKPVADRISQVSPLHKILMETAYYSRCATSMLDIPRSCPRKAVYNDSTTNETVGYAQLLARIDVSAGSTDVNAILYPSHSALFAPWGQYKYVGTGKQNIASPSFIALLVQRAQILNQSMQYEWALPTNRKHNLQLGKFDYKVPKKLLDVWQKLEGVGVNVLTEIPELGTNLWGNSTLYEVPPATYQALANLSTRYLMNAVEDIAYKCGISITFQYNNEQAYNKFYAGVTPLLDTMKNVGAIEDYYVRMAADINGLDQVNANTVIGKIYLVVNGVINDIIIDLIALPPGVDLEQFKS